MSGISPGGLVSGPLVEPAAPPAFAAHDDDAVVEDEDEEAEAEAEAEEVDVGLAASVVVVVVDGFPPAAPLEQAASSTAASRAAQGAEIERRVATEASYEGPGSRSPPPLLSPGKRWRRTRTIGR